MTGAEVLRVILRDFGLVSREDMRRGAFAQRRHAAAARHARRLPAVARRRSTRTRSSSSTRRRACRRRCSTRSHADGAYEQDGQRLLQIVLCGQPLLLEHAQDRADVRAERAHHAPRRADAAARRPKSRPTSSTGSRSPAAPTPSTFEPDALRLVAELSRGLPRRDQRAVRSRAAGRPHRRRERSITPRDSVKRAARVARRRAPTARRPRRRAADAPSRRRRRDDPHDVGSRDEPSLSADVAGDWPRSRRGSSRARRGGARATAATRAVCVSAMAGAFAGRSRPRRPSAIAALAATDARAERRTDDC